MSNNNLTIDSTSDNLFRFNTFEDNSKNFAIMLWKKDPNDNKSIGHLVIETYREYLSATPKNYGVFKSDITWNKQSDDYYSAYKCRLPDKTMIINTPYINKLNSYIKHVKKIDTWCAKPNKYFFGKVLFGLFVLIVLLGILAILIPIALVLIIILCPCIIYCICCASRKQPNIENKEEVSNLINDTINTDTINTDTINTDTINTDTINTDNNTDIDHVEIDKCRYKDGENVDITRSSTNCTDSVLLVLSASGIIDGLVDREYNIEEYFPFIEISELNISTPIITYLFFYDSDYKYLYLVSSMLFITLLDVLFSFKRPGDTKGVILRVILLAFVIISNLSFSYLLRNNDNTLVKILDQESYVVLLPLILAIINIISPIITYIESKDLIINPENLYDILFDKIRSEKIIIEDAVIKESDSRLTKDNLQMYGININLSRTRNELYNYYLNNRIIIEGVIAGNNQMIFIELSNYKNSLSSNEIEEDLETYIISFIVISILFIPISLIFDIYYRKILTEKFVNNPNKIVYIKDNNIIDTNIVTLNNNYDMDWFLNITSMTSYLYKAIICNISIYVIYSIILKYTYYTDGYTMALIYCIFTPSIYYFISFTLIGPILYGMIFVIIMIIPIILCYCCSNKNILYISFMPMKILIIHYISINPITIIIRKIF